MSAVYLITHAGKTPGVVAACEQEEDSSASAQCERSSKRVQAQVSSGLS